MRYKTYRNGKLIVDTGVDSIRPIMSTTLGLDVKEKVYTQGILNFLTNKKFGAHYTQFFKNPELKDYDNT